MLLWILGCAAGIAGFSFVRELPSRPVLFTIAIAALLCVCLAIACKRSRPFLLLITGLFVGIVWGGLHGWQVRDHTLPPQLQQRLLTVDGMVLGLPMQTRSRGQAVQQFQFKVQRVVDVQTDWRPRRIQLAWYGGPELRPGERLRLQLKLKPPRGFANPVGLDYQLWLIQNGIDATGYAKGGETLPSTWLSPGRWLEQLRWRLQQRIIRLESTIPGARFLRALGLGDAKALNSKDWDLLRATGTTHLFVVSGLHISLVSLLAYGLGLHLWRLLARGVHGNLPGQAAQGYAAILALIAATLYALLAGFGLPARRALTMLAVVWLALLWQRPVRTRWQFALALFLILLFDPLAARSAGFYLSFGAVAVLLLGFGGRLRAPSRRVAWLRAQLLMFAALTPLLLYWFQAASLLMPVANLFAVPFVSVFVVPLVLLLLAWLALFGDPSEILLQLLDGMFSWLWYYLQWLVDWQTSGSQAMNLAFDNINPGFVIAVAMLLLLPRGLLPRGLIVLCSLPLLLPATRASIALPDAPLMTVLDVGQGLAVVVEAQGKALVYDAGPQYGVDFDAGEAILVPFLRQRGYREIDTLVLSHSDSDHAGGLASVLESLPVNRLYSGEEWETAAQLTLPNPLRAQRCLAGKARWWQGLELKFLHPTRDTFGKSNNHSCVLKISSAGASVLLSGDIEKRIEAELVAQQAAALTANLLIVPHHGSKTSSSIGFIAAVDPDFAIHSAAYLGRFGHPHPDVVARLQNAGTEQFNTANGGAILIQWPKARGEKFKVERFRRLSRKYWWKWN